MLPQGCTICGDRAMREKNNTKAASHQRHNPRLKEQGRVYDKRSGKIFGHKVKAFTYWTTFPSEDSPLVKKKSKL